MATRWKLTRAQAANRSKFEELGRRRRRRCQDQVLMELRYETNATVEESDLALNAPDFERTFRDFSYEDPRTKKKAA